MVQAQVLRLLEDLQARARPGDHLHHPRPVDAGGRVPTRIAVMYAGRIVERGPSRGGLHRAGAPVHARARGRLPDHRRPGLPHDPPACPATRPTRASCRAAARSIRAALARSTSARRRTSSCGRRATGTRARPACTSPGLDRCPRERADAQLLEVRGVHVEFPAGAATARAVDGVDLTMNTGEIVALVGRVGLRQDDAGPHDRGAAAARRPGEVLVPRRAAAPRPARCASTGARRR